MSDTEKMHNAFVLRKSRFETDLKGSSKERGARKLVVTEIYHSTEVSQIDTEWNAPQGKEKSQVVEHENLEFAVFNESAKQDKHYHKIGTEIYTVLEGLMSIEVEENVFSLEAGDTIVVEKNSVHEIKPEGAKFLTQVITVNCQGQSDKYIVG